MIPIIPERLAKVTHLDKGSHYDSNTGMCVMDDIGAWLLSARCEFRADGKPARGQPVINRLYGRVFVASSGCWEFQGGRDDGGYGTLKYDGATWKAHRLGWHLLIGGLGKETNVCHSCDNPCCINPAHWFIGTVGDNNRDRHTKGRTKNLEMGQAKRHAALRAVTHCPHGHAYDEANTLVRKNGGRECRACSREEARHYRSRNRDASNARRRENRRIAG